MGGGFWRVSVGGGVCVCVCVSGGVCVRGGREGEEGGIDGWEYGTVCCACGVVGVFWFEEV